MKKISFVLAVIIITSCIKEHQVSDELINEELEKIFYEQNPDGKNEFFLNEKYSTYINWDSIITHDEGLRYIKVSSLDSIKIVGADLDFSLEGNLWIKAQKNADKWKFIYLTFVPSSETDSVNFVGKIVSKDLSTNSSNVSTYRSRFNLVSGWAPQQEECIYAYVNGVLNTIQCSGGISTDDMMDSYNGGPGDYNNVKPGGGTGPGNGTTTAALEAKAKLAFNNKIDASTLPDCMKGVIEMLKTLSDNTVADIITKFAGELMDYNLAFSVETNENPMQVAGIIPIVKDGFVTIGINNNRSTVQNVTDLAFATTIMHESIHAYLVAYYKADPTAAKLSYPALFDKYSTKKALGNDQQHEFMTEEFINDIAASLKMYGEKKNYTIDDQIYKDLAWKGLTETDAFGKLSEKERTRIVNRIMSEQYDTKPNEVKQAGKRLGC